MAAVDPYIGVVIEDGGYELVAKIGEGTMGAVYRGVQPDTGTEVAVKILHVKYALEREFVERFKREVRVLGSLRHPNTVRIIGHGQMEDTSLYIVMELLEGRGLDEALRGDGPWPLDRAISMVLRVAYALEEAHRLGIVHRDLKPENIFLVQRPGGVEIPKLLDFGLAKLSRPNDSSGNMQLTQEGDILGTPAFMSPEQSFGEPLDGRADIYSLAVILYELLTGQLPFEETSNGPQIARYLNDPIPIDQRVEGIDLPPDLWPVMHKALQKLPEDRYPTVMEFAEALQPFNTVQLSLAPPAARAMQLVAGAGGPASVRGGPASSRSDAAPMSGRHGPVSQRQGSSPKLPAPPMGRIPSTPPPPNVTTISSKPPPAMPAGIRPTLGSASGIAPASTQRPKPPEKRSNVLPLVIVAVAILAALVTAALYLKR